MRDLREVILQIRQGLGLTQTEFARRLGIKPNTVSQYETGTITPSTEVLLRLHGLATDPQTRGRIDEAIVDRTGGPTYQQLQNSLTRITEEYQAALRARLGDLSDQQFQDSLTHISDRVRAGLGAMLGQLSDQSWKDLWTISVDESPEAVSAALERLTERKAKDSPFSEEAKKLAESGLDIQPALVQIVRLYREHGQSVEVRALFRKVLGYLEVEISQLGSPSTGAGRSPR